MLLDRNLLDTIVALPKNLFYGTDITTYLWILDNKRPAERRDKVLFIDAAHAEYTRLLQKNLGKKRFEVSEEGAEDILNIYRDFKNCTRDIRFEKTGEVEHIEVAKLLDYDDFLYTNVAIRRPLRLWYENIKDKYIQLTLDENFDPDNKKNAILKTLSEIEGIDDKRSDFEFFSFLKSKKVKTVQADIKLIRSVFGTISEDAPIVWKKPLDEDGEQEIDTNLNDTEKIPMKEDIDEYFEREVLPYAPDAWMDRDKDKVGCEFPFTRIFYIYRPLRSTSDILAELAALDKEMATELLNLKNED